MKQDTEFEKITENVIFVCKKCHCRMMGGKNVLKVFEIHEKDCDCKEYEYVVPGDKYYTHIRTYSDN